MVDVQQLKSMNVRTTTLSNSIVIVQGTKKKRDIEVGGKKAKVELVTFIFRLGIRNIVIIVLKSISFTMTNITVFIPSSNYHTNVVRIKIHSTVVVL